MSIFRTSATTLGDAIDRLYLDNFVYIQPHKPSSPMNKKRRDFLKLSGIVGATSLIPFKDLIAARSETVAVNSCVLVPSETAGPFTLDLTENTYFFRQDIRESHAGVQLNLKLRVIGSTN